MSEPVGGQALAGETGSLEPVGGGRCVWVYSVPYWVTDEREVTVGMALGCDSDGSEAQRRGMKRWIDGCFGRKMETRRQK
jgi:hypothetical protein